LRNKTVANAELLIQPSLFRSRDRPDCLAGHWEGKGNQLVKLDCSMLLPLAKQSQQGEWEHGDFDGDFFFGAVAAHANYDIGAGLNATNRFDGRL